jgi:hypothetical protein
VTKFLIDWDTPNEELVLPPGTEGEPLVDQPGQNVIMFGAGEMGEGFGGRLMLAYIIPNLP